MYYEDVDLCRRIRDKGGLIAFFDNITVEHNHGGSSRINVKTYSLTKTEVFISRHVYISKHLAGFEKFSAQLFLVINNIVTGMLSAIPGAAFFFIPGIYKRTRAFAKLFAYYINALLRLTWISPRSINYKTNRTRE